MNSDGFAAMRFMRDGDYLKIKYMGLSIADVLPDNEHVVFYGANYLSWMIYQDIKDSHYVDCFIDANPQESYVADVPVLKPDSVELKRFFDNEKSVRVIVIPTWALKPIEDVLNTLSSNYVMTPVECLFAAVVHKYLLFIRNPEHIWRADEDPLLYWNKPNKHIKAIFTAYTAYSLFLYFLICPDWRHTYIQSELLSEYSARKLNKASLYNDVNYKCKDKYKQYINTDLLRHRIMLLAEYAKRYSLPVYGHDHMPDSHYFFGTHFTLIEDGLLNYKDNTFEKWHGIMDDGEEFIQFGNNKYVNSVILTGRLPVKDEIRNKTIVVDIKKLWRDKSKEEREEILSIFNFPKDKLENLVRTGHDHVLLCQNFMEAAGITEGEQVDIYKKILSNYDQNRVIIKPHPDDKIDYKRYFPECEILAEPFPAELMLLMDVPIAKIIGVTSTTLYGFFPQEKVDAYPEFFVDPFRDNMDYRRL